MKSALLIAMLTAVLAVVSFTNVQAYYRGGAAYNPYTGGHASAYRSYNPYTGRSRSGSTTYNPYNNTCSHTGTVSNPRLLDPVSKPGRGSQRLEAGCLGNPGLFVANAAALLTRNEPREAGRLTVRAEGRS
jgi:hypothetical protein